jgi:hypothetical protein
MIRHGTFYINKVFVLKIECVFFFWNFLNMVIFDGKFQKSSKMEKKLCGFCFWKKNYVVFSFGTNEKQ